MKHAYLIAAHNQFEVLKKLIQLLDYPDNDIYVHIDIKAGKMDYAVFQQEVRQSKMVFLPRKDITWGGYSQIQLELELLKEAVKEYHDYYHFISGVDMPIKTMKQIDHFFSQHRGLEFIHFDLETKEKDVIMRIGQYHFLQNRIGRRQCLLKNIENLSLYLQKNIHIDRIHSQKIIFKKGANWFSITHQFSLYILQQESWIKKVFGKSICADELFMQTLAFNSEFKNKLYYDPNRKRYFNMRLIDWDRGNPYVFHKEDCEELLQSDCIFARKFDLNVDADSVETLYSKLTEGDRL